MYTHIYNSYIKAREIEFPSLEKENESCRIHIPQF